MARTMPFQAGITEAEPVYPSTRASPGPAPPLRGSEDKASSINRKLTMGCQTPPKTEEKREKAKVQGVRKKTGTETPVGFVPQAGAAGIELTIVIPCLNEAETLAQVIDRARRFLHAYDVAGEVVGPDHGSTHARTPSPPAARPR